jgi:gluconolactonase
MAAAAAAMAAAGTVRADEYAPDAAPVRYPDHRLVELDKRFAKLKLGNTPIQRLYHSENMMWAEGPAWNGSGRYLVWSDIPNNRSIAGWKRTGMCRSFATRRTTATATPSTLMAVRFLSSI